MKKLMSCILIVALLLTLAAVTYAAEITCVISVDSVSAEAGGEVTVPIRITDNPGFTNFSLRLYYDREILTLKSLENVAGDVTSVNPEGKDAEGADCVLVVGASAEAITEDMVLFNAVFTVSADFSDTTEITPVVTYIRNNTAVISIFEEITATVKSGNIEVSNNILLGDVNGDGKINSRDAMLIYAYLNGRYKGNTFLEEAADVNGDGKINSRDAMLIYAYVNRRLTQFSGAN